MTFILGESHARAVIRFNAWPKQGEREHQALVGVREWSHDDRIALRKQNIQTWSMRDLSMHGLESVCDGMMEWAQQHAQVSLLINANVLDAVFVKQEQSVGGLTPRELLYILSRLKFLRNLTAVQVEGADDALRNACLRALTTDL